MMITITCTCGNKSDFDDKRDQITDEDPHVEGFEFSTSKNHQGQDILMIHCEKCDHTVVITAEEDEDDE